MPQDTPQSPGGAQLAPSGTAGPTENDTSQTQSVSYETHRKLLGEKKRAEEKQTELERQMGEMRAEQKRQAEAKMLEEKNLQGLLDVRNKELEEERTRREVLEAQQRDQRKAAAFLGALTGQIDVAKYGPLINLEKIVIDPQSGEPDAASVTAAAREFEAAYPEIVQRKTGVTLPADASRGGNSKITYVEWLKLPVKEMLKRQREVM